MSGGDSSGGDSSVVKWLGYGLNKLSPVWKTAAETFTKRGGSAEQKLGELKSVEIKSRKEGPVHKSHFNPQDPEEVLSVVCVGAKRTKTCHVYADGKGTTKKGETPE
ncbi:MAG: hypothetical protein Q9172_004916 [Xanthocarpia lactea]